MHEDELTNQIATFVRRVRRDETLQIDADTAIDSLGIDSLDFVELLFMIEEKFDIDIPFNANDRGEEGFPFATVGSAAVAVRSLIAQKSAAA